jgi:hypothetical protein
MEEAFGIEFRIDPISIGTNNPILGDSYAISLKSKEDRYDHADASTHF